MSVLDLIGGIFGGSLLRDTTDTVSEWITLAVVGGVILLLILLILAYLAGRGGRR